MDQIQSTGTELETTTTENPAEAALETAPSTPETLPATIESNVPPGTDNLPGDSTALAAYTPNFKFKVMDKELEVPEYLRAVMKDSATEKQVIEILQKAEGLPIAKERLKNERDEYRNKFQSISDQVKKAHVTYQRGDIDGFLDLLKIPHERMLQWAVDKVSYSQLPVEQKQVHDQSMQAQRRAAELEENQTRLEQQFEQQAISAKQAQLSAELIKPEVKSAMDQYDAVVGKPGAFVEEIMNRGRLAWSQRKEDISPAQAVQEVLQVFGKFLSRAQPTPQVIPAPSAVPTQGNANPPKQTTIPNVQGKSASPVKKGPRSLDDLKKLSREAQEASHQ